MGRVFSQFIARLILKLSFKIAAFLEKSTQYLCFIGFKTSTLEYLFNRQHNRDLLQN